MAVMSVTARPLLERNWWRSDLERADPAESSMSVGGGRGREQAAEWREPVGLWRGERMEGSAETRARRAGEEDKEEEEKEGVEDRRGRVEARAASMKAISSSLTISTGTGLVLT